MLRVVRWFISSLYGSYAGRTKAAGFERKPYNPILGEQFRCRWQDTELICEQVSHHPPITAFHLRNGVAGVQVGGHCGQMTRFTGTAIKVEQVGRIFVQIRVKDVNEEYIDEEYAISLPELYLRGLLTGAPFVELCGETSIVGTNGMAARIKFLPKPWIGGEYDLIEGQIYYADDDDDDNEHSIIYEIWGKWSKQTWYQSVQEDPQMEHLQHIQNGIIDEPSSSSTSSSSSSSLSPPLILFDVEGTAPVAPTLAPLSQQGLVESRRVWHTVTAALCKGNYERATEEKNRIEEEQRALRKQRLEEGIQWQPALFYFNPAFFLTTEGSTSSSSSSSSASSSSNLSSLSSHSKSTTSSTSSSSGSKKKGKSRKNHKKKKKNFIVEDYPGRWVIRDETADT